VDSTEGFDASGTAYIDNGDETFDNFTYTGKTPTAFTGVTELTSSHEIDDMVVQEIEGDTTLYDYDCLLPKLKDRVYKLNKIDDNMLFSQSQSEYVSKRFLEEFVKNHTKISVDVLFSPHLSLGQTIQVISSYNNINRNYFIESITENNEFSNIVLAFYP
jgi:hypothetical protein